jgi:hypothetical protein
LRIRREHVKWYLFELTLKGQFDPNYSLLDQLENRSPNLEHWHNLKHSRNLGQREYKMWNLYKFAKKSLSTSREFGIHNIVDKLFYPKQTLGAKNDKRYCHVDILEAIVLWPLASSVKDQHTNFCSPPIKLLKSIVLSTNDLRVKYT